MRRACGVCGRNTAEVRPRKREAVALHGAASPSKTTMHLRHQLAVYSPISPRAVGAAAVAALVGGGDSVGRLEGLLRREYAADDVLLCGSGTQALQVAIEAARGEAGRDAAVALPAFSCFDVASAAIGAGGPVILYDLDPPSLSPDLESLDRALAAGARIVVVAPLYGVPVDWDAIEDLASTYGATLIEDAAQGHGATLGRRPLGSLGEISTLSFGRGKGWTGGSGGAVLFRGGRRASRTVVPSAFAGGSSIRTAMVLAAQWALGRPSLYGLPRRLPLELGETVYHEPRRPMSISNAAAAALLANRDASLREAERRRANAQTIRAQIADHPGLREATSRSRNATTGHLRFALLASGGLRGFGGGERAPVERLGVAASYPKQLGELPQLAPLVVGSLQMPGAARLVQQLVTLPVHSLESRRDWAELTERIAHYAGQ
jgi:dTDP-4-amino-4,6-dideoxygalactose transaminase